MAGTDDFSEIFNLSSDFDMLGKDIDLSGGFDLAGGEVDLFGEPFALPSSEDKSSTPLPDASASADAISTSGQGNVEPSTVSPQVNKFSQATKSPAQASPSKQGLCSQPPRAKLPSGKVFKPVSEHVLKRKCSPPPITALSPSSMRPQVRAPASVAGFPQRTQFVSSSIPMVGYTNMGPPPPGPLNIRRYAPLAPMHASPPGAVADNPSRKRKADTDEVLAADSSSSVYGSESPAAFDETGRKPIAKKRRLEQPEQEMRQLMHDGQTLAPGSTDGQAVELDLQSKEKEALGQAMEYRRLRNAALDQATEYKRLGTSAIQRYNNYREKRHELSC